MVGVTQAAADISVGPSGLDCFYSDEPGAARFALAPSYLLAAPSALSIQNRACIHGETVVAVGPYDRHDQRTLLRHDKRP